MQAASKLCRVCYELRLRCRHRDKWDGSYEERAGKNFQRRGSVRHHHIIWLKVDSEAYCTPPGTIIRPVNNRAIYGKLLKSDHLCEFRVPCHEISSCLEL
jgi:hypothetical protein